MPRRLGRLSALTAFLWLAGASAASAVPVVVEYFIDAASLKDTASTDALTLELFDDDTCTSLLGTSTLFAGDPLIQYYVDKTQRAAGAPKAAKVIRMRAIIDAPTSDSAVYVRVTGGSLVAAVNECQLQGGSPIAAGPTGPQGPQGPAGSAGADGAQGVQGVPGPAGSDGADGEDGAPGADGAQGPPGADGADGTPGADGADGTSGSLIGGNHSNQGDGAFLMPWDVTQSGTEGNVDVPVSSGTASKLMLGLSDALGGTDTATLTLRKNGVSTALTCTITSGSSTCSDTTTVVSFADGDLLSLLYNESGSPDVRVKYTILYQAP